MAVYYSDYRVIANRVIAAVEDAAAHNDSQAADKAVRKALLEVETMALARWAHWKDGVQYVGSCGTTLKAAEQVACDNAAENQP